MKTLNILLNCILAFLCKIVPDIDDENNHIDCLLYEILKIKYCNTVSSQGCF